MDTEGRYPTCTRNDFIRLLDMAHEEARDTTATIIKAIEAAANEGADAAVAVIAQYVLDNGHILDAAEVTTGKVFTLAAQDRAGNDGRFEEALNLWEAAWEEHHDIHTGPPTTRDNSKAAQAIRDAIGQGHEQARILRAAHYAGATFCTNVVHFLTVDGCATGDHAPKAAL